MKIRGLKSRPDGFTLIEILIATAIFVSLLGVILYFGFNASGLNIFLSENLVSQNELQLTLNSIVVEVRSMGPSSVGGYPIESANAGSFVFFSDTDNDGLFERVRYYYSNGTLMRGWTKPSGNPLLYDHAGEKTTEAVHFVISQPSAIFTYYSKNQTSGDGPMTVPINPNLVRAVKIELAADRDPDQLPEPVIYRIFATIRNFRNQ